MIATTSRLLVLLVLVEHLKQLLGGIIDTKFEEADSYKSLCPYLYRDRKIFVCCSFKSFAVEVSEEIGSSCVHRNTFHHFSHTLNSLFCIYFLYCGILPYVFHHLPSLVRMNKHTGHAIAEGIFKFIHPKTVRLEAVPYSKITNPIPLFKPTLIA